MKIKELYTKGTIEGDAQVKCFSSTWDEDDYPTITYFSSWENLCDEIELDENEITNLEQIDNLIYKIHTK